MMGFSSGPQKKKCQMCGGDIEVGAAKAECEKFTSKQFLLTGNFIQCYFSAPRLL
jgi:hypothetical protein